MSDDPHARLDARLRAAFEPGPHAAARIAGAVLADRAVIRRRRWLGLAAAAAAICTVSALVFWPSPPIPRAEPAALSLSGFLTDGLVIVSLPDGSVAITGGEARRDRPQDGFGLVLVEGELR